jgi:hypothetical protein
MIQSPPAPQNENLELDADIVSSLKNLFEEQIVFNKLLGLKLNAVTAQPMFAPAWPCGPT